MLWQPTDLSKICPADTQLTACSAFAYFYLGVLVKLFGDSKENRINNSKNNEDQDRNDDRIVQKIDTFESKEKYYQNKEDNIENNEVYDFIIVGAGTAGCVVANRLTENKQWKVLLLEAGPEEPDISLVPAVFKTMSASNINWKYQTQYDGTICRAQPGERCPYARGKVMGGCSAINGMVYIRGNKRDFDEWAEQGNEGWSYRDVLPYFKKSENNLNEEGKNREYHSVEGPLPISRFIYKDEPTNMMTEAYVQKGLPLTDFNAASQLGAMVTQNIVDGNSQRASANTAFIRPIRYKRKNLTVRTESEVTEILIDPKTKKAYGVKYTKNKKWYKAVATKEVIVSAGSINSPKLLMLSGVGPKEHLKKLHIDVIKDLPVGQNFQDHVTIMGIIIMLSNKTATRVSKKEIIDELYKYKNSTRYSGPLAGNVVEGVSAIFKSKPYLDAPDLQVQCSTVTWEEFYQDPTLYLQLPIFPISYYNGIMARPIILQPTSRGVILLNSTDPVFGPPLIYTNYFSTQEDVRTMLAGVKFLLSLEATKSFKSRGAYFNREPVKACANYPWGTDAYFICMMRSYTAGYYHAVGTCKMGPKWDYSAVVNPKLKVYGIKQLRVIDASIMPSVTRGNTVAPTFMIGEKGADLIKQDWS